MFDRGRIDFSNTQFFGAAYFSDFRGIKDIGSISFEGSSFDSQLLLTFGERLPCPLDLRRTRLSHNVVLNDVVCDFPAWPRRRAQWHDLIVSRPALDSQDSQRFRRLKELALSNRNHAKAMEFHIQEIRSRRVHETRWWQDIAQFFFWLWGDYGRSIIRPLGWIGLTTLAFATIFWSLRTPIGELSETSRSFWTALTYSSSNMLSFIPTGRTARSQGETLLFGETVPDAILALGGLQSAMAVILLFLLGLGLRNLFRV